MKWFKAKSVLLLLLVASLCFTVAGSAFAFNDIQDDQEKNAIESLYKQGIISGTGKGKYEPKGALTVGNAVALIVKGMDLNIDHIRFIKEPKASDYYTKVKDNAWYANAFIVAYHNGLDVPREIDPNANATREQFAHWLYNAIEAKGEYAWIEIYMNIEDEDQVDPAYMTSIQRLLIGKIAVLDKKGKFHPKQPITRSEAAGMLHRAIEFVKNTPPVKPADPQDGILTDVKLTTETVNAEIVKVTVSAQAPHPGYGLEIANIAFQDDKAVVSYRLVMPDPAALYPQVITEVSAVTYIPANFKAELGSLLSADQQKQETEDGTKHVPIESPAQESDSAPAESKAS